MDTKALRAKCEKCGREFGVSFDPRKDGLRKAAQRALNLAGQTHVRDENCGPLGPAQESEYP